MFASLQNALLSLVYPQQCRVCAGQVESMENGLACRDCWSKTRIFNGKEMLCNKCGALFGTEAAPIPVYCHQCDEHLYEKAAAVGIYENALAASVIGLKSVPQINKTLSSLLPHAWRIADFKSDILIPIPLSRRRRHERGFNQAELIAAEIARFSGVPVDTVSLVRTLHTRIHRIAMDDKARELSVKNAFEVARPKLIVDKNIVLIDDVLTSGATASHCAKVLKKNGAASVNVFTLARAVLK